MDETKRHKQRLCYACKACWFITAKANENKTFQEAVIVSLTAPNQDYKDIKTKMRKTLRTSSLNSSASEPKMCRMELGGDYINVCHFPYLFI